MDMNTDNRVLLSILRQRHALTALRKEMLISRTDMEVLAYAKLRNRMITVYEVKKYFPSTNIQQLRAVITKLELEGLLNLVTQGVKNRPSVYWLSDKGQSIIDKYLTMI